MMRLLEVVIFACRFGSVSGGKNRFTGSFSCGADDWELEHSSSLTNLYMRRRPLFDLAKLFFDLGRLIRLNHR